MNWFERNCQECWEIAFLVVVLILLCMAIYDLPDTSMQTPRFTIPNAPSAGLPFNMTQVIP